MLVQEKKQQDKPPADPKTDNNEKQKQQASCRDPRAARPAHRM